MQLWPIPVQDSGDLIRHFLYTINFGIFFGWKFEKKKQTFEKLAREKNVEIVDVPTDTK